MDTKDGVGDLSNPLLNGPVEQVPRWPEVETQKHEVRDDHDGYHVFRRHPRKDVKPIKTVHAKSLATGSDRNRSPLTLRHTAA